MAICCRKFSTSLTLLGTLVAAAAAVADDEWGRLPPALAVHQQECSACHLAYPPQLLPGQSWQRLMDGLQRHFGVNAALEDAQVREISRYLVGNAAPHWRAPAPANDRITSSSWFVRKHRRFGAQDWAHPSVGRASNCAACHTDLSRFDDDAVRLPVGLSGSANRGRSHD